MGNELRSTQLPIIDKLAKSPQLFDYEQCVYLLENFYTIDVNHGAYFSCPILTDSRHLFYLAPYDINSVKINEKSAIIYAERMSFSSFHGPLPSVYSERIGVSEWFKNHALSDFFNIFINRLSVISYRVTVKKLPTLQKSEPIDTNMGKCLNSLTGRQNNHSLLQYASLLWDNPRSALGLRLIIANFFQVNVKIEQFNGGFIEKEEKTFLGKKNSLLGNNASLGKLFYDFGNSIKIQIGPLTARQIDDFQEGKPWFVELNRLINSYLDRNISYKIEFIPDDIPEIELGFGKLSYNTWLTNQAKKYESVKYFKT